MPKYHCSNEHCTQFCVPVDIDTSFLAYYSNLEHKDFLMRNKKFYCCYCGIDLVYDKPNEESKVYIGKYGMASYEEKMNMLRKRSRDVRIPQNREQKQRKEYMDRNGITKYVN